ncbi:sugar acetyltransferase inhibitor, partial [Escherichia coli]|nr:sugar acetyltransferase inhibitor [Escherichia coli]
PEFTDKTLSRKTGAVQMANFTSFQRLLIWI